MSSSKPYQDTVRRLKDKWIGKEVTYQGRKYIVVDVIHGCQLQICSAHRTAAEPRLQTVSILSVI